MDERTAEILRRFEESWIKTKAFYDRLSALPGWSRLTAIKAFIVQLEQSGGKQKFRLGTSVHLLLISRSFEHGLRSDQRNIRIEPLAIDDFEVLYRDGDRLYHQYRVKDLNDEKVLGLLKMLESRLID